MNIIATFKYLILLLRLYLHAAYFIIDQTIAALCVSLKSYINGKLIYLLITKNVCYNNKKKTFYSFDFYIYILVQDNVTYTYIQKLNIFINQIFYIDCWHDMHTNNFKCVVKFIRHCYFFFCDCGIR